MKKHEYSDGQTGCVFFTSKSALNNLLNLWNVLIILHFCNVTLAPDLNNDLDE